MAAVSDNGHRLAILSKLRRLVASHKAEGTLTPADALWLIGEIDRAEALRQRAEREDERWRRDETARRLTEWLRQQEEKDAEKEGGGPRS
jgi:hypothetical protein